MEKGFNMTLGLKSELYQLAEGLTIADFRALSRGVGNGEICRKIPGIPTPNTAKAAMAHTAKAEAPREQTQLSSRSARANRENRSLSSAAGVSQSRGVINSATTVMARIMIAHILDLGVAAVAILSMLVAVAATIETSGMTGAVTVVRNWILGLRPMEILAAVYGTFLIYAGIFKIFLDGTIGSHVFRKAGTKSRR